MDALSSSSSPEPRLRVMRSHTTAPFHGDDIPNCQSAGPSRVSHITTDTGSESFDEDDLDAQSTPKMPLMTCIPPSHSPNTETPAARLRALLARVPNNSGAKPVRQERPSAPPSELESDFDPPRFTPATPSIARESLKDLFSRALREPGDTPRKERRRRNSIDVSEVEANPRVDRERAKDKGKRCSLSDEGAELPSSTSLLALFFLSRPSPGISTESSQRPTTSSHAAALIALREKVERSFANSQKMSPLSVGDSRTCLSIVDIRCRRD